MKVILTFESLMHGLGPLFKTKKKQCDYHPDNFMWLQLAEMIEFDYFYVNSTHLFN